MRKRIVITLLAIVVIGVGVFVLTRPKPGTVEWHKREFSEASNYLLKDSPSDRVRRFWWRITGQLAPAPQIGEAVEQVNRMESNRVALVKLGYFVERKFCVTNSSVDRIASGLMRHPLFRRGEADISNSYMGRSLGKVEVTARPKDVPKIEAMIRALDVP
jgi:hypothetical protein